MTVLPEAEAVKVSGVVGGISVFVQKISLIADILVENATRLCFVVIFVINLTPPPDPAFILDVDGPRIN